MRGADFAPRYKKEGSVMGGAQQESEMVDNEKSVFKRFLELFIIAIVGSIIVLQLIWSYGG